MTAMCGRLAIVSAERVRDELVKLVLGDAPPRRARAARGDRPGAARPARAARARAGGRRAPPAQGRLRAHPHRAGAGHRPRVHARAGDRARLRAAVRRTDARRRQAAHPPVRGGRPRVLPPPRGRRRPPDPQAHAGVAVLQRDDRRGGARSSSCTCVSTATATASGPTAPCAATSATPDRMLRAPAQADPCRLHDAQPAQGRAPRAHLRRARGADRAAVRGGGARGDPARARRQPDHGDPGHPAGPRRGGGVLLPARAAPRPRPDGARTRPSGPSAPGGPSAPRRSH